MKPTENPQTPNGKKYCFTGKLRVGKDHCALAIDSHVIGFADPMYRIVEALHGKIESKDETPGYRKLLQQIGQWGRGVVNESYPLTAERASITAIIRAMGSQMTGGYPANWASYGVNEDIWVEALLAMSDRVDPGPNSTPPVDFDDKGKAASSDYDPALYPIQCVTNVRFPNEKAALGSARFQHFHVLCSDVTYVERLRSVGMSVEDPRLNDLSEQYARELDVQVANLLRTHETGTKINVIWNDTRPIPSARLYTVEEFKQYVKENEQRENTITVADEPVSTEPTETVAPVDTGEGSDNVEAAGDTQPDSVTGYQD
jgi:hypothetical protein